AEAVRSRAPRVLEPLLPRGREQLQLPREGRRPDPAGLEREEEDPSPDHAEHQEAPPLSLSSCPDPDGAARRTGQGRVAADGTRRDTVPGPQAASRPGA